VIDDPAGLTNGDLARIFHEIGDMLELKGELVFKTVAYHRAADAIGRSPVDLVSAYRAGKAPRIAGVGKAIGDKIEELATTGHLGYLDRLRAEMPASLIGLLELPGLGPKTVRQLHEELGITTMDDLRSEGGLTSWLVMALVPQGKSAESAKLIAPVVKYERGLAARNHGDAWVPFELAAALYAQALTDHTQAPALLREAGALLDALPADILAMHDTRLLRDYVNAARGAAH